MFAGDGLPQVGSKLCPVLEVGRHIHIGNISAGSAHFNTQLTGSSTAFHTYLQAFGTFIPEIHLTHLHKVIVVKAGQIHATGTINPRLHPTA